MRIVKLNTVQREKSKHGMSAYALISVNKCVILNKSKTQPGSFLLEGWKCFDAAKGLKGSVQGCIKQIGVPYTVAAAGGFDQSLMQKQNMFFT